MTWQRRRSDEGDQIPEKANRALYVILIFFLLIALRVWHLTCVQNADRLEEAMRPMQKVVVEQASRGTIRDRFNIPLVTNKISYKAAVVWSDIAEIPASKTVIEGGEKVRKNLRREHVQAITSLLAKELDLDPDRLEDLIYSKASFYYHVPYVVKENITELQYARLKAKEGSFRGIRVLKVPRREYPRGKSAATVIGYMGAITREELEENLAKISELKTYIQDVEEGNYVEGLEGVSSLEEAKKQLAALQELSYALHDSVGKAGVEAAFETSLRGIKGKRAFLSDAKGNFLKGLSEDKDPESGARVLLNISVELQEYAEQLLAMAEPIRKARVMSADGQERFGSFEKEPWIKGGAIVALKPTTGEIVALATFPRFDPNDFFSGKGTDWFEDERVLEEIWNQKRTLNRELFSLKTGEFINEEKVLTWKEYLNFSLHPSSLLYRVLEKEMTLGKAISLNEAFSELMELAGVQSAYTVVNALWQEPDSIPYQKRVRARIKESVEENLKANSQRVQVLKRKLDSSFHALKNNYDKVLLVDMVRLIAPKEVPSEHVLQKISPLPLENAREFSLAINHIKEKVFSGAKEEFHRQIFAGWRKENQKSYLKEMRLQEKREGKRYQAPYLDLLDKKERELFQEYWTKNEWSLLLQEVRSKFVLFSGMSDDEVIECLKGQRAFSDLNRPLWGRYRSLRAQGKLQLEKHLAEAFYPKYGFGFMRSYAFQEAQAPGSVFKIVTALEVLRQRYDKGKRGHELNPLVINDDYFTSADQTFVGHFENGKGITQNYKGGRIPRSHRRGLGKMDLMRALEVSSNPYFSLLASDHLSSGSDLARAARELGLGQKTGLGLGGEKRGNVPADLDINPTGLYTAAVGQHTLLATPLQIARIFAVIANGGKLVTPKIVQCIATPLGVEEPTCKPCETVEIPEAVRATLLEGMRRVVVNVQQSARGSLGEMYRPYGFMIDHLVDLKGQIVGKSSTAEAVERVDLDCQTGLLRYNHLWFGSIIYEPGKENLVTKASSSVHFDNPELCIVVMLRFGSWGKDAVPIAAEVAAKWREIKKRHAD